MSSKIFNVNSLEERSLDFIKYNNYRGLLFLDLNKQKALKTGTCIFYSKICWNRTSGSSWEDSKSTGLKIPIYHSCLDSTSQPIGMLKLSWDVAFFLWSLIYILGLQSSHIQGFKEWTNEHVYVLDTGNKISISGTKFIQIGQPIQAW